MLSVDDVSYEPPTNCTASLKSIIANHFSLLRLGRTKQHHPKQITDELLFIVKKVNETADKPKECLAQLGIVIFPEAIALKRAEIAKLLSICKVGLAAKLHKAEWTVDVMCPSLVKAELRKVVGEDFKKWMIRGTPRNSAFYNYTLAHGNLVTGRSVFPDEADVQSSPIIHY